MMETGKKIASMDRDNLLRQMVAACTTVTGKMTINRARALFYKRAHILLKEFGTKVV